MWKKAMAAAVALLLTAAASAEVYEGKTAAQRVHEVYAEGSAETICAEVGQTVSEGETLLTLRTQKVFATQDGTLARVLAAEGETVDGVVMEITGQIDIELAVPVITGASIKSARVGEAVTYGVAGQAEAVEAVLEAIDWQGFTGEISEINVGTLDDLYLVTVDGLIIRLGDSEKLDEKILTARSALVPLRAAYAMRGAVLDVSTGDGQADFQPM